MKSKSHILLYLVVVLLFTSINCNMATSLLQKDRQVAPPLRNDVPLPDQNNDQGRFAPPVDNNRQNPVVPPVDNGDQNAAPDYQLEGTWISQTDTGFGTVMDTELILEYTGTFSQLVTAGSLMTLDTGIYEVGDGFIRFVVENHEPKEYNGQAMSWATGFTYFYYFVDEDTISFEDHISGNSWLAYRE
ncbi:MAG: hypothetical protein PHQ40_04390 [Anaerolineaceae bacterium]|nr:hypothetical protein [Anaerolineaceae bacterium]